ncbi:hypothetical protein CSA_023558, partial [Cucumis sativus]
QEEEEARRHERTSKECGRKKKVAKNKEVDRLKVVVEKFGEEFERTSPLKPRSWPKEFKLVDPSQPKKGKGEAGTSRLEDVEESEPQSAQELHKLIKTEK